MKKAEETGEIWKGFISRMKTEETILSFFCSLICGHLWTNQKMCSMWWSSVFCRKHRVVLICSWATEMWQQYSLVNIFKSIKISYCTVKSVYLNSMINNMIKSVFWCMMLNSPSICIRSVHHVLEYMSCIFFLLDGWGGGVRWVLWEGLVNLVWSDN